MADDTKTSRFRLLSRFGNWLPSLPTTNFRIFVTMAVFVGTAVRYWLSAVGSISTWEPSWEWLMFLTAMSGLDVAQYSKKRTTAWRPDEVASAIADVKAGETNSDKQNGG